MRNEILVKSFIPGAAIGGNRIVKFDAADGTVILATAATEGFVGIADDNGAAATDDTVDVVMEGIAEVKLGGTVTRGAWLTSDANGAAIATTTAGNEVIGRALESGVSGDIRPVLIGIGRY